MASSTSDRDSINFVPPKLKHATTGLEEPWPEPGKAWEKCNLLSLDGGGVRGYWSLLVLDKLMDVIAYIEQNKDENAPMSERHAHSFHPEKYPNHVTRKLSKNEQRAMGEIQNGSDVFHKLTYSRRYLPCHYFDYICGSSTGSLIAIMLGRFRMSVCDCKREYESLASKIFGKPRMIAKIKYGFGFNKYSTKNAEEIFKKVANQRCDVSESSRAHKDFPLRKKVCKTFVTSLASECRKGAKRQVRSTYLIRSYDHTPRHAAKDQVNLLARPPRASSGGSQTTKALIRKINYGPAEPLETWEVARAATAAPLFFRPFESTTDPQKKTFKRFVDGGLHAENNPTLEGVQEVWGLNGPESLSIVLSVGTARTNQNPGSSIKSEIASIVDLGNDPEIRHVQVKDQAKSTGFNYFRFNDLEGSNVAMDECEPKGRNNPGSKTFAKLENHFNRWVNNQEISRDIWRCAVKLVKQRRARTGDRGLWETFSTGSEYRCSVHRCEDIFTNRYDFRDHYKTKHRVDLEEEHEKFRSQKDVWEYQAEQDPPSVTNSRRLGSFLS